MVTLSGSGFSALSSTDAALRASNLRCRFGATVQQTAPSFHNDTHIVCIATWGEESMAGQPVTLSLNGGASFAYAAASVLPRFFYEGLHPPAMVEVFFKEDATLLVVRLDSQPTNRAGMNGVGPCSQIFDDNTSATLRGTGTAEATCAWFSDTVVFAQLTMATAASSVGMTVTLREGVLWPRSWEYPGTCDGAESMCAKIQTLPVNEFFPCDRSYTENIELCVKPIAVVQGPTEISSCPGSAITLDGARSTGGGIKPLVYSWRANPLTCDKYAPMIHHITLLLTCLLDAP